ncbi:MAG: acetyl-CoA C-acetyltransferase [Deltaproteobacteria bacterium]|nr:acetyl-CoA C-acetyltransferase [Deltaproteobacteria bacterium]MCB9478451.1 acetyl-CoA C-acetyltransferase [Deltaproteobacteria bacterium]MCB9489950.1 acetyl-CoA C-acetyltransferase [Deltaproteobacteria bacterium]
MSKEVWIVGAARTPVGGFNGALASVPAPQLGAIAIKEAVSRAGVKPEDVDECIMGCVLPTALGQAPARQAMIHAGLPNTVAAMTINKVCGSGLKAVGLGAQSILCGDSRVVVAGGMENMSAAPHALPGSRNGFRMGPAQLVDTMVNDGLWDSFNNCHMGNFADKTAVQESVTREELDEFTVESYKRAQAAIENGKFKAEIVPVEVPGKKGPTVVDTDEDPARVNYDKIPDLRPAFNKDGVITAANASSINDGAAALVLVDGEYGKELGLKPLAKVVAQGSASREPEWFTLAPIRAIENTLKKAGLTKDDIDLWEINQAFSVVSVATEKTLGLDRAKVDVNGGAIAIGHPIGASGARILCTLLYAMQDRSAKYGLATLCIGGGEAFAMIFERVE